MRRLYFISVLTFFIAACGSTSAPVVRSQQSTPDTKKAATLPEMESIEALLERARLSEGNQQLVTIVNIVSQLSESDCERADFAASELLSLVTRGAQSDELLRVQLHCALQQRQFDRASEFNEQLSSSARNDERVLPLRYELALHQQDWLQAANIYYRMSERTRENAEHIWRLLNNISNQTLEKADTGFSPLAPWLSLITLQRRLPLPELQLEQALRAWQQRYSRHFFAERWPESFEQVINTPAIARNNVVVLLPLSGRWQEQGEAIKSGILAANFSMPELESSIRFFDSNFIDAVPVEALQAADIIIGPLLKENIDAFAAKAPKGTPQLFLNRLDEQQTATGEHYFYALAPEDEAQQLALQLVERGITTPVVVAAQSGVYQRMQQRFAKIWQTHTQSLPLTMSFENNSSLRDGIDTLLDISESKARIRQIENMLSGELQSIERSRRDIDAIVVFANASQTELINPIIESSISPFADIVPVFATSRSYSSDLNKNSLRDLRNLTFIEMPWMLPSKNLNYFQTLTASLWPNRSDTEKRLFAMGYDAFNLIPDLRFLRIVPQRLFKGLTGTIILAERFETVRELSWATVENDEVSVLGLD